MLDRQKHASEHREDSTSKLVEAVRLEGHTSDSYLTQAMLDFVYGEDEEARYRSAQKSLERAIELKADNLRALKWMSSILILQDESEKAQEYISRALEISPTYRSALGNMASAKVLRGKRDDGYRDINNLIETSPDWAWALRFRASVEFTRGEVARAMGDVAAANQIEEVPAGAALASLAAANTGLFTYADAMIDEMEPANDDMVARQHWLNYKKAIIRKNIDAALRHLETIMDHHKTSDYFSSARLSAGFMYLYRDDNERAEALCEANLPENPSGQPRLAETCFAIARARQGDTEPANSVIERFNAAMPNPDDYYPYWNASEHAALYVAIGDHENAKAILARMVDQGWRTPMTTVCRHCLHFPVSDPRSLYGALHNDAEFSAMMEKIEDHLKSEQPGVAAHFQ